MSDEIEIVKSPLCRTVECDGITVRVEIYSSGKNDWILDVVTDDGASTVWVDEFESDKLALEEFERTLAEEGMASIVSSEQ